MSFSKDGERLTRRDLAGAAEAFAKEDPGLRGRVTQQAEMALVLEAFGRTASDGSRFFTRADAKQLFVGGQGQRFARGQPHRAVLAQRVWRPTRCNGAAAWRCSFFSTSRSVKSSPSR